ncbi:MAG: response regulator, partial [Burkholderiales bacterium]
PAAEADSPRPVRWQPQSVAQSLPADPPTLSLVPNKGMARDADSRPRILLAEDNGVNQEVACAMLHNLGCEADVAHDGAEALERLAAGSFDAVLMDCQMPRMDGFEASREIRSLEAQRADGRRVPIIALTANAMEGDRERCLEAGMDDYLAKPFKLAELGAMLERWLVRPASDSDRSRANLAA